MKVFCKIQNNKGVALMYSIMVLMLLSVTIVALTALSSTSYSSAVHQASEDQAFYYAKSVGLAFSEQLKSSYDISKILDTLKVADIVTGTYTIDEDGDAVSGDIVISYAMDSFGNVNQYVLDVTVTAMINGVSKTVTSVYSCEDDMDPISDLDNLFSFYDVVLTNTEDLSFRFNDWDYRVEGSRANVYVYAGEDDTVVNPIFRMEVDMDGMLTMTGSSTLVGWYASIYNPSTMVLRNISGNLTSYGNLYIVYIECENIYATGTVNVECTSKVRDTIYARDKVFLTGNFAYHDKYFDYNTCGLSAGTYWKAQAKNIVALDDVFLSNGATVQENIKSKGSVNIIGTDGHVSGNTVVLGSIYAAGNVNVTNGAIVKGNIYCSGGSVTIASGAIVLGNVYADKGEILVENAAVCGSVNCAGKLYVYANDNNYASYLGALGFTAGYGGIGYKDVFNITQTLKSYCGELVTYDSLYVVAIGGSLTVAEGTYEWSGVKVTPLLSVWSHTNYIYLKNSTAVFGTSEVQTRANANRLDYKYTYLWGLWQNNDMALANNTYVNFLGSQVINLRLGSTSNNAKNGYLWNGLINVQLWGKALYLADMWILGANVLAKESLYTWGTGIGTDDYTSGFCVFSANATANVNGLTTVGGLSIFNSGSVIVTGKNTTSDALILAGDSFTYCTVYATGNVSIEGHAHLSNTNTYVAGFTAMSLCVTGTLNVWISTSTLRYGSTINLQGEGNIFGTIYNLNHDGGGTLNMYSSYYDAAYNGAILGTFFSNAGSIGTEETLNLNGDFGNIYITGTKATLKMTGKLVVTGAVVCKGYFDNASGFYGSFGSLYVGTVTGGANFTLNVNVAGNATIANGITFNLNIYPLARASIAIGGEVLSEKAIVTVGYPSGTYSASVGSIYGGTVTVNQRGTVNGRVCSTVGGVTVSGTVKGNIKSASNLALSGGTVGSPSSSITANCSGALAVTAGDFYGDIKSTASGTAATVSGGTIIGNIMCPNGSISVTGEANTQISGNIDVKNTSTIRGAVSGGIYVRSGALNIGSASDTEAYPVGIYDAPLYGKTSVNYTGKAYPSAYIRSGNVVAGVSVGSTGNVVIGSSTNRISGYFGEISSGGSCTIFATNIYIGVYAEAGAAINVTGTCGMSSQANNVTKYGVNSGGNVTLTGGGTFKGTYIVANQLTISGSLSLMGRIKTSTISGLDNIAKVYSSTLMQNALPIDLYLSGYSSYTLAHSLMAYSQQGVTGGITILNGALTINSPIKVEGEIYVGRIFTYNGSTQNLISVAGLHCLNQSVTITADMKGNIDLPNVTSVEINSNIDGLNAPKVTSITLNADVLGSLALSAVTSFTVRNGASIGGNLIISNSGNVVNFGTVGGIISAGYYNRYDDNAAKGTAAGLILSGTANARSNIYGNITGNIYACHNLRVGYMDATGTTISNFGASDAYIYTQRSVELYYVSFNTGMDKIVSSGGDIYLKECLNMPNLYNSYGKVRLSNGSDRVGTIKNINCTGTYVQFGTGTHSDYQTVTGYVQWGGYTTSDPGIISRTHTIINGYVRATGTGNVNLGGKIDGRVDLINAGTATVSAPLGSSIFVNQSGATKVTGLTISGTVTGSIFVYGSASLNTLSLTKSVGGLVRLTNVATVNISAAVADSISVQNGNLNLTATCGGSVYVNNGNLTCTKNITGGVFHSGSTPIYEVNLGTESSGGGITVGGAITASGTLNDNSANNGTINVLGTYKGGPNKNYRVTSGSNYTRELNVTGIAFILGGASANRYIDCVVNVSGWLLVYNYSASYKIYFTNTVLSNCINVNSWVGVTDKYVSDYYAPSLFGPGSLSLSFSATSTSTSLVNFSAPVFVTAAEVNAYQYYGTAYIANSTFNKKSVLRTEGQTCLTYCTLYSEGYKNDEYHCFYNNFTESSKTYKRVNIGDGSMFVHARNNDSGRNTFYGVTTYSNVSVFYGKTYMNSCTFNGCTMDTSAGVTGHSATRLFYFGDTVEMYASGITDSESNSLASAQVARTIVWVRRGDLYVCNGSYIGYITGVGRKTAAPYRKADSYHPGLFVSTGSVYVTSSVGLGYSVISMDIMVKGNLNIWDKGVVVVKGNDGAKYDSGFYCVGGSIIRSGDGWFAYYDAKAGGRTYYSGGDGDSIATKEMYTPYASYYATFVNSEWSDGTTQTALRHCYTPVYSLQGDSFTDPTGAGKIYDLTTAATSANNVIASIDIPTKPTISSSGSGIGEGDGSVDPLTIISDMVAETPTTVAVNSLAVTPSSAPSETGSYSFYNTTTNWGIIAYAGNGLGTVGLYTTVTALSAFNAATVARLDTTNNSYWNPRAIPYIWGPADHATTSTGAQVATMASRVLKGANYNKNTWKVGLNGTNAAALNYVTEDCYQGSKLQQNAANIVKMRMQNDSWKDYIRIKTTCEMDRLTTLMFFESGVMPMEAFYISPEEDRYFMPQRWKERINKHNKWVSYSPNQYFINAKVHRWGNDDRSEYNCYWVFYACENAADPYGSTAKDLHIILPKALGVQWEYDSSNNIIVLGRGRVFLYLQSGTSLLFRGDAIKEGKEVKTVWFAGGISKTDSEGTLLKDSGGNQIYRPQLYIIGCGTNIDIYLQDLQLFAYVYMPFGISDEVYNYKTGILGPRTNVHEDDVRYPISSAAKNTLVMHYDVKFIKPIYGTIVVDNLYPYTEQGLLNGLRFKVTSPDLSDTTMYRTIYTNSSTLNATKYWNSYGRKTYSLSQFMFMPPGLSTDILEWSYVGIKT